MDTCHRWSGEAAAAKTPAGSAGPKPAGGREEGLAAHPSAGHMENGQHGGGNGVAEAGRVADDGAGEERDPQPRGCRLPWGTRLRWTEQPSAWPWMPPCHPALCCGLGDVMDVDMPPVWSLLGCAKDCWALNLLGCGDGDGTPPHDSPAAIGFQHPQEKEGVYPPRGLSIRTPVHVELYQTCSGPAGCLGGQNWAWGGEPCSQPHSGPWEHGRLTEASPSGTCMDPPRAAPGAALLARGTISPNPDPAILHPGDAPGWLPHPHPKLGALGAQRLAPQHGAIPPLHPCAGKSCNLVGFGAGGEKWEKGAVGCRGCCGCCGHGCPGAGRTAGAAGHCQVTSAGARKSDSRCIRSAVLQFQFHRLTIIFRLLLVPH
ncbi:PREDICTED: uncharacterized protein LOC104839336 [Haliaeetus leucocephalus]|uniref:uncharacterized protein LOC104839336 n=1 Tax=Haliaeetus leucocephalus TaxID=52644 RepID=UPI00053CD480|nr:PREDICTED: uncharacterized protein LOC104839336 [Haliaeetus leucocephalus]